MTKLGMAMAQNLRLPTSQPTRSILFICVWQLVSSHPNFDPRTLNSGCVCKWGKGNVGPISKQTRKRGDASSPFLMFIGSINLERNPAPETERTGPMLAGWTLYLIEGRYPLVLKKWHLENFRISVGSLIFQLRGYLPSII
jgi:hypothetical protein